MFGWAFGSRLSGSVDQVPGAFSVQTRFAHLARVPILPRESWLVLDSADGRAWQGVKLDRLSWRSISFAWARLGFVAMASGSLLAAFAASTGADDRGLVATVMLAAASAVAFLCSYRFSRCNYDEAIELVRELRLGREYELMVGDSFQRAAPDFR
ncbi:MAG TPA: hypothetical protein VGH20_06220 [Myxococcales bacterium]